ncbi:MAG: PrsW family glutamic-type intramembrane protease [Candidatus Giovannonibacteria bacterium]|nr:PrsW family glutamic-type intramembrane protease [Candidatus Giovannonibacteria bacterium]
MGLVAYILLAGALAFLPSLFWLWFWLKEDDHPEPRREIFLVFLAGMLGVVVAVILENSFFLANLFFQKFFGYSAFWLSILNIFGFAFLEEITKTAAAFFTAIRSKYFDEPVDAMIYMVAAALGFAALENILFLGESLKIGVTQSIMVSAFRFINALLIHISATAIIGSAFAFSFFHKERRLRELFIGLFFATLLHGFYNFFIIKNIGSGAENQIWITFFVISGAAVALVLFERAKRAKI